MFGKTAGILDSPRADRTQRRRLHISHDVLSAAALDDKGFDEAARKLDTEPAKLKEVVEYETGVFIVSHNA